MAVAVQRIATRVCAESARGPRNGQASEAFALLGGPAMKDGRTQSKSEEFLAECNALGRDCARARLRLDAKTPSELRQAFEAFSGPTQFPSYHVRKWLGLRLSAVKRGMVLAPEVDVGFIEDICAGHCPVTLEEFDVKGKSPRNPSVDRLVNEGTYAAGNIAMLSIRANRAKGAKTFEQVLSMASAGDAVAGLEGIEWMRLATLMYGAWSVGGEKGDPYLIPFATYPAPRIFTTQAQNVQWLLLRHCADESWPASVAVWVEATKLAGVEKERFWLFAERLRAATAEEVYQPTAWLHPGVFEGFADWYHRSRATITELMCSLREKYQAGIDPGAIAGQWRVGSRYLS